MWCSGIMKSDVLDHGFVRLDACMADDLSVVNAARVSFGKRVESMRDSDAKLVAFLIRERHGTPFEHNAFRFHIKAPLFVVREWQRHRIASYNELSGRYVKFENPDFFIPDEIRQRVEGSKPGAYKFEKWQGNQKQAKAAIEREYRDALDLYEWLVDSGVATEHARIVLPAALYTEFYWTANCRSILNFLSLRNSDQALQEIREYAKVVEDMVETKMPVTIEAFRNQNRVAP